MQTRGMKRKLDEETNLQKRKRLEKFQERKVQNPKQKSRIKKHENTRNHGLI